jgi:DNA primase
MSTVDDVKQRLDIVDVIGGYVKVEKSGRYFKASCPFHEEKTPSFFVFPDRQTWKCFGCGAGGDLVSFVMKKEGTDFSQALKMLAERAGVPLARKREVAEDDVTGRLFRINEAAARYYQGLLVKDPRAEHARRYVNERGLDQKAVEDFQLGFSGAEGLQKHLLDQGFRASELLALGLAKEKEGRTYDQFRNRLMFPICDIKGNVLGFGARALDDSMPKYLNSPQTSIFDKGGVLYGIDRAKGSIREKKMAIVVEGYMDVIAAHQHGATNVVASMGTALTEKQIGLLAGLTKTLAFALDPDAAGSAATLRGVEVARRSLGRETVAMPGLLGAASRLKGEMRIISLPKGKDPDTLIREDPGLWQELVDGAQPVVEHLITVVASQLDLTRPEGKSRASEQLLPIVSELEDDVEREFYLGRLASLLEVNERTLAGMAARMHRPTRKKTRVEPQPVAPTRYGDPLEEHCLSLLLQHPELSDEAEELSAEHFERSENREVFMAWRGESDLAELRLRVGDDLGGHVEALSTRFLPPAGETERRAELSGCVCRLEERRLRLREEFVTSQAVDLVSDGGDLEPAELASIQEGTVEVDARLVRTMQERTGTTFPDRGNQ